MFVNFLWWTALTIPMLFGCQSYAYDAMWSIALALSKAEQEVDGWLKEDLHHRAYVNRHGPELMHLIRSGSFRGASGLVQFNSRVSRAMLTVIRSHTLATLNPKLKP